MIGECCASKHTKMSSGQLVVALFLPTMSPITDYLRSSSILFSHTPSYDDKGRQLPFDESPPQRRERRAFVKSLQWQRNVATWMDNQHHSTSNSHSSVRFRSVTLKSSPILMISFQYSPRAHLPANLLLLVHPLRRSIPRIHIPPNNTNKLWTQN